MIDANEVRRERIRICHVVLLPELDGAQRCMLEILRRLDPTEYDRHVACSGEGPLTAALRREGITVHVLSSLVRPIRPLDDRRALGDLRSLFERYDFDIVHTHSSKPGFLGRIAARKAGTRQVVHHVQGFAFHEYSHPLARWFFVRLEKYAGRSTDRLIFVNNEERELAIQNGWFPHEICTTVFNGVDLGLFDREGNNGHRSRFRGTLDAPDDEVLILFASRLEAQKQPLILPEIAAVVEAARPNLKWRILVAGTGSLEKDLIERMKDLGVDRRIQLIGWHPEPQILTSSADIALLPSLWEGLPLVLLEALADSLPIVASRVKGNREVVTDETGFLCEPKDPDSYARALISLLDDREMRKAFGAAGRRRAQELFQLEKTCGMVESLYLERNYSASP